jgi:hypothetical protein
MLFVDVFGRPSSLSDVPMTYMKRATVLKKRGYGKKEIDALYCEDQETIIIDGC